MKKLSAKYHYRISPKISPWAKKMKMPKIPGWAYSRAKNICLENRPIPPLKMTHICMFKMRFITFRTVFKQELFFFFWCGDLENF